MARGVGAVRVARVRDAVTPGRPRRAGDLAATAANQWRPALAVAGGHAVVAWEDERDGPAQVYVTRTALRRLR
jgi:hypothetical protein